MKDVIKAPPPQQKEKKIDPPMMTRYVLTNKTVDKVGLGSTGIEGTLTRHASEALQRCKRLGGLSWKAELLGLKPRTLKGSFYCGGRRAGVRDRVGRSNFRLFLTIAEDRIVVCLFVMGVRTFPACRVADAVGCYGGCGRRTKRMTRGLKMGRTRKGRRRLVREPNRASARREACTGRCRCTCL